MTGLQQRSHFSSHERRPAAPAAAAATGGGGGHAAGAASQPPPLRLIQPARLQTLVDLAAEIQQALGGPFHAVHLRVEDDAPWNLQLGGLAGAARAYVQAMKRARFKADTPVYVASGLLFEGSTSPGEEGQGRCGGGGGLLVRLTVRPPPPPPASSSPPSRSPATPAPPPPQRAAPGCPRTIPPTACSARQNSEGNAGCRRGQAGFLQGVAPRARAVAR